MLVLFSLLFASTAFSQPYIPGQTYYGRNNYIEYYAGDLALVFSAPHGGSLTPGEIPDRTYGTTVTDSYTRETTLAIRDAIFDSTGHYPHIIISNLKRTKLDPNREIVEAAQGNQWAEQAWNEYHGFIEIAKDSITAQHGKGFYVDIHGHGHELQRLELGYLISGADLFKTDGELNTADFMNSSSIRALAAESSLDFAELLRGDKSLGTLFEENGIQAVPSLYQPDPGSGNPYFSGGYSTVRHGSRDGGTINGVQIEAYKTGLRDTPANRKKYAQTITEVFDEFFREHFGWDGIVTYIEENKAVVFSELFLAQNYPNPFSLTTTIEYFIPGNCNVKISIFNPLGQITDILVNEFKSSGIHRITWDASEQPGGLYIYRIEVNGSVISRKMILLKY